MPTVQTGMASCCETVLYAHMKTSLMSYCIPILSWHYLHARKPLYTKMICSFLTRHINTCDLQWTSYLRGRNLPPPFLFAGNPPGYFTNGANAREPCTNGTYAAGWGRRTSCTPCGAGIYTELRTVDETDGSRFVAAQSTDCCKFFLMHPLII